MEPAALYYRFALAIEGEQDVIEAPGVELKEALAQLEAGPDDPTHWEEQVHFERSGVICSACRARLIAFVGGSTRVAH